MENTQQNKLKFEYIIEYNEPIPVSEFTSALGSISNQYQRFLENNYGAEKPDAKLYIQEVKKGSIIATLVEYSAISLPFLGDVNTIFEFGQYIKSLFSYFVGDERDKKELEIYNIDKKDLENLSNIVRPATHKDNRININIIGDNNNVEFNALTSDENSSTDIIENIKYEKRSLEREEKISVKYKKILYLEHIKKDLNSTKGNKGVITELSNKSFNIIWENEEEKERMLNCDANPFKMLFVVDVQIIEVKDKIDVYKIVKLHEILEQ